MNEYVLHLGKNNNIARAMGMQMPIFRHVVRSRLCTYCPVTQIFGCKKHIIQYVEIQ